MSKNLQSVTMICSKELVELWRQQEFSLNMLAAFYTSVLPKLQTNGVGKVQVILTGDVARNGSINDAVNVIEVFRYLDVDRFIDGDGLHRKRMVLDLLHHSLLVLADERDWDKEKIEAAYTEVIRRKLSYCGYLGRAARSPDKKRSARVYCRYEDIAVTELQVTEKGEETSIQFGHFPAGYKVAASEVGAITWTSDHEVTVAHKNKQDFWVIDTKSKTVRFSFARAEAGDAHGQYDLAIMYLEGRTVCFDRELGLYWLEQAAKQGYKHAKKKLANLSPS